MSTDIVETRSPWQQAADAITCAASLLKQIPGSGGYQCTPETDLDLRGAAALVQRAVLYLRAAVTREAPRLEAIEVEFEARRQLPPWDQDSKRRGEDSD